MLCFVFTLQDLLQEEKNPPTILSFLPDISIFLEQLVTIFHISVTCMVTSDIDKTFEKTISPSMLSSQALF